ncbi:MAG: hypothetical protein JSW05_06075 [Candidatus Thorarchaeota archaeon]|nr:MAG: hypothetical protein JSW05_06075 [Candidatus Thorarchaeota archaeon]
MREVSIHLGRRSYAPGDIVEGTVIVLTDEMFDCNSVNLRFLGTEKSRVVRGSGKHRRVYEEELTYFDEFLELEQESTIPEGETRYEFGIELPPDTIASYTGIHGYIKYEIEAKVEVSWALDPRVKVEVPVMVGTQFLEPMTLREKLEEDETRFLEVEVERDVVRPGESVKLEVRLTDAIDFRGLRCEILHEEKVSPKGREEEHRTGLVEWYTEEFRLPKHVPVEIEMKTGDHWPRAFQSPLITCSYILKVTLDIAWRFDKVIEIPLRYGKTGPDTDFRTTFGFEF